MHSRQTRWNWAWLALLILPAVILTIANRLAQPPQELRPRIFVIGLSKTGTTSVGDALALLGYRRLGWRDIRSRQMVHAWANNDMEPLIAMTQYYDAFEDLPWPFLYRDMAERYPDAKFILSLRSDEDTWLRSMRRHVGRGRWEPYTYFYGADVVDEATEATVRHSYRNHTADVRAFFADQPHRLLELNIDDMNKDASVAGSHNKWHTLCQFAICPPGYAITSDFPHANKAAAWNMGPVASRLHWLWGWTVTRIEELAAFYSYQSGIAALKPMLGAFWYAHDLVEHSAAEIYYRASPLLLPQLQLNRLDSSKMPTAPHLKRDAPRRSLAEVHTPA